MPDVLSQPTSPDIHMYPMPQRDLLDTSPQEVSEAAEAIANAAYIDAIARPDAESQAVEDGRPLTPIREGGAVNGFETVRPASEVAAYATNTGAGVDPLNAEAVLAAAASTVDAAYAASPEAVAAQAERERQAYYQETLRRAQQYGPLIEDNLRGVALINLSAEAERD